MGKLDRAVSKAIVRFVGAVCYLSLFFPCFLGPLAPDIAPGMLAPAPTWAGCAVGGAVAMAVAFSQRLSVCYGGERSMMAHGAALALSCAPSLIALFGIESTTALLAVCDFLRGASLVGLGVGWSQLFQDVPFGKLLTGVAAASFCSMILDMAQPFLHAGGALVLAVGAVLPLLGVGSSGSENSQDSAYLNEVTDAPKAIARSLTLSTLFRLFASSTLGFALLVVLDQAQMQSFLFDILPVASLGVAVAALVLVAIAAALREELTLPFLQWVLFPLIAAVLIVLDSFPLSSGLFRAGSVGVFLFFSLLGLFAVALLVKANGQGEIVPSLATGLFFLGVAAAAAAGRLLVNSGLALDDRGALLLALATAYLVFLLVAPALRLWREARGGEAAEESSSRQPEQPSAKDEAERLDDQCEAVALAAELSRRETEVLKLAARGYTSTYISKALFISDSTVRTHLKSVYRKTGVASKVELIDLVREHPSAP